MIVAMVRVQLLWTGGWDSTFRLLQLLLVERRPVQPYYVIDVDRLSMGRELRAMQEIRERLVGRLDQPDLLAPTQVVVRTDFPVPDELTRAWQAIASRMHIGPQYLWLAAAAERLGWSGVELSMERHEPEPLPLAQLMGAASRGAAPKSDIALFRFWRFPLLEWSKEDMAAFAAEHGFIDVLALAWSCHAPIAGRRCGRCRPCRLAGPNASRPISPSIAAPVAAYRAIRRDGWRSVIARVRDV